MKLKNNLIILVLAIVVTGLMTYILVVPKNDTQEGKVVYIDNMKVFEQFQLKKDMDKMLEKDLFQETSQLDQLSAKLNAAIEKGGAVSETEKQNYTQLKNDIQVKFENLSKKYTAQVYERLNNYIADYGKQNKIRFILGANGQGNVMYVEPEADLTNKMIAYINKKYLDK